MSAKDGASAAAGGSRTDASATQQLIDLASADAELFPASDGQVYAVWRDQPHRATPVTKFVAEVVLRYYGRSLQWPSQRARSELADWARMTGRSRPVRKVFLRSAWLPEEFAVFVDTGDAAGSVLKVTEYGSERVSTAPVAFRRADTTAELSVEKPGGSMEDGLQLLWSLVPVATVDRPVVLALLLTCWLTGVPQPVVLVSGPRDSGKTTTARFLLS